MVGDISSADKNSRWETAQPFELERILSTLFYPYSVREPKVQKFMPFVLVFEDSE